MPSNRFDAFETFFETLLDAVESLVDVAAQRSDHGYHQCGQRDGGADDHDRSLIHYANSNCLLPMRARRQ